MARNGRIVRHLAERRRITLLQALLNPQRNRRSSGARFIAGRGGPKAPNSRANTA
jgi:hypothetical protein